MAGDKCIPTGPVLTFGPFRLLPVKRVLQEGERPVRVGGRALDILLALVERPGELVSKEELIARVWPNIAIEEATLRVHIAGLRKVLGGNRYIENVTGRGYRFVAPVTRRDDDNPPPAEQTATSARRHNIPAPLTRIIGRSDVVSTLAARLPRQRFVTIAGPGGIGKTTVALAAADRLSASYRHGACFVDLATITDPLLVAAAVASSLGLTIHSDNCIPALLAFLEHRQLLLVLDNCEHVIETAATLAVKLLRAAPGLHILATSREALRSEGEWTYRLSPLSVPASTARLTAAEAMAFSAIQLFTERAAASLDGFELGDSDVSAVADLCRRLDGIPLAIELAAARVDLFGLRGLTTQLGDCLQLLTQGRRTAMPRHQTLRATLDWSYSLLSEAEQVILRRIAVFPGPFDLEAASMVAAAGEVTGSTFFDAISNLAAKSLIMTDVTGEQILFRLLDTTRVYALEKLKACGEHPPASRRHAEFCCLASEQARAPTANTAVWLARFGRNIDDVRVALDWCFSPAGDTMIGANLAAVSAPIWFHLSVVDEYRRHLEWVKQTLKTHLAAEPALEMRLNAMLGYALMHTKGPITAATAAFARALEIADLLDDGVIRWRALCGLGMAHIANGAYSLSVEFAERAQSASLELGDEAAIMSERMMALTHHLAGNLALACRYAECVLARPAPAASSAFDNYAYQVDHRVAAGVVFARGLWIQGFPDRAMRAAHEAVAAGLAADHALSLCFSLLCACPVALWTGDMPAASRFIGMMLDHATRHSLPYWHFWGRCFDTAPQLRLGHGVERAESIPNLLRDPLCGAIHRETLATFCEGVVDTDLIARAKAGSAGWCGAEILRIEGEMILKAGAAEADAAAEAAFRRSLDMAHRQGARSWALRTATSLARLWRDRGRAAEARTLLADVYSGFSEGFATADLVAAKSVLDELAE
jgi:predicted ATPase/DNA-binding winged helix-turn-helix (wHTH) protein